MSDNFDKLNSTTSELKLIEFYIDIFPFIEMYKKRNDIQDGISTKDILEHWNEELAHEFSDFKYVDIEQIGSDEDNCKFIIALLPSIDSNQEKNILEWIDTDMVWGSGKLFIPFSEWESEGSDWEAFAEDCYGHTDLDAYEFTELLSEAENSGKESLYPAIFKAAEKVCETSEDYRCLADYAVQMLSKDLARNLYEKAEENVTTIDDLKYLKDSIEDEDYLGDKDWASKLQKKIENFES